MTNATDINIAELVAAYIVIYVERVANSAGADDDLFEGIGYFARQQGRFVRFNGKAVARPAGWVAMIEAAAADMIAAETLAA